MIAPQGLVTPAGLLPRVKQFTVVGLFNVGMFEYDAGLALIHLQDAQQLYQMGEAVSGVRLKLKDLFESRTVARDLAQSLGSDVYISDWTRSHANFFRAVEIEKRVMFLILTLIVLVAALNIISGLTMLVKDKGRDIAILRTMGATKGAIMRVFLITGSAIGVTGTIAGVAIGLIIAHNLEGFRQAINKAFGINAFDPNFYLLSRLPSVVVPSDVITITLLSLCLSLIATIYPSWRAAKLDPVEALRYE